jgi:hypothetical protein
MAYQNAIPVEKIMQEQVGLTLERFPNITQHIIFCLEGTKKVLKKPHYIQAYSVLVNHNKIK